MSKINYQLELDKFLEEISRGSTPPTLALHSCCAPCSAYVLEYLTSYFNINVIYYNPNISTEEEFNYRMSELRRLIESMPLKNKVTLTECEYNPQEFYDIAKGCEACPERGTRCHRCYQLRLEYAAKEALRTGADYFATTLTLSPLKDASVINAIGEELSAKYGVAYLPSDFKKRNGYKRSIELSKEFNLYRQNFCGCVYSKKTQDEKE